MGLLLYKHHLSLNCLAFSLSHLSQKRMLQRNAPFYHYFRNYKSEV